MTLEEEVEGLLKGFEYGILMSLDNGDTSGVHGIYKRAILKLIKENK